MFAYCTNRKTPKQPYQILLSTKATDSLSTKNLNPTLTQKLTSDGMASPDRSWRRRQPSQETSRRFERASLSTVVGRVSLNRPAILKKRKSLKTQKNYLKNDTNSELTRIMKRIGIITINGHLNMLIKMLYKWDSNKWVWENMQDLFLDWLTLFFTLCASFYGTDHRMEFVMRIFFMNTRV